MLSSGSFGARVAVLRDVLADPSRPVKLGPHEGEDFVDLLLRLVPGTSGVLRQLLTMSLMSYQDPRTTRFMSEAFGKSRDAAIVLRLGQRLWQEQGLEFFRPFLWGKGSAQALVAAQLCECAPGLTLAERLRIGLLLPDNAPVPPLDEESLAAWVEELGGPYRAQARRRCDPAGARLLWTAWDRLAAPEQEWLLQLDPEQARAEVPRLLAAGCRLPAVVETAHRCGLSLPDGLLDHAQPAMRALAIAAGQADANLEPYLSGSLAEALAATRRCSVERLLELLGDERWQVRAQAVRQLAALEPRPLEPVRARVASASKGERIAAIELLRVWGEEAWLEQTFSPAHRAERSDRESSAKPVAARCDGRPPG